MALQHISQTGIYKTLDEFLPYELNRIVTQYANFDCRFWTILLSNRIGRVEWLSEMQKEHLRVVGVAVETLNLNGVDADSENVRQILEYVPAPSSLIIGYDQLRFGIDDPNNDTLEVIADKIPHLQELIIQEPRKITKKGWEKLAHGCRLLKKIKILGAFPVDNPELRKIAEFSQLRSAVFISSGMSNEGLKYLQEGCPKLEKLNIAYAQGWVTNKGLEYIGRMRQLKWLDISEVRTYRRISAEGFKYLAQC